MPVVSITLPSELLKRFDRLVKSKGYFSRSEAFREAIRGLLLQEDIIQLEKGKRIAATVMVIFDSVRRDTDLRLTELRSEYDEIVMENIHRHIGDEYCLEIFIAEGEYSKVLEFVGKIRGIRGIIDAKLEFLTLKSNH
ncbi:MAG: CopG family ribbon-helix-helix protein [Nitrososphaerales archaeon]